MRVFFVFYLIIPALCFSQKKVYNTKIDTANKVIIYGGNTTITKVDSLRIEKLVVNQETIDSIYFIGYETVKDTSGNVLTMYKFSPSKKRISFDVDISISLDTPFIPLKTLLPSPRNFIRLDKTGDYVKAIGINKESVYGVPTYTSDYKTIRFRGRVVSDTLLIIILTPTIPRARISGVFRRPNL